MSLNRPIGASGARYHVWCLSWEDDEDTGHDVVGYDPLVDGWKSDTRSTIWVAFGVDMGAKEAAERYAAYCHAARDGWEASWPLMFRVRWGAP